MNFHIYEVEFMSGDFVTVCENDIGVAKDKAKLIQMDLRKSTVIKGIKEIKPRVNVGDVCFC